MAPYDKRYRVCIRRLQWTVSSLRATLITPYIRSVGIPHRADTIVETILSVAQWLARFHRRIPKISATLPCTGSDGKGRPLASVACYGRDDLQISGRLFGPMVQLRTGPENQSRFSTRRGGVSGRLRRCSSSAANDRMGNMYMVGGRR